MTPANPDALADAPYVLLKRGLFERPGHHGYTGVLRHAGRFSHEEASAYAFHGGSVTMMLASEAPVYSPACWHETQVEDLLDLLRIEREAKATAEARAAQLQAEVEAWKRVAVVASVALEPIRMSGADKLHAPKTAEHIRLAVTTIRMAMDGHLPPAGDYEAVTEPARTALAARAATAREGQADG